MTKNRKLFIAAIQSNGNEPGARVYRIKRNKPDYIGFVGFITSPTSTAIRDNLIIDFLKYNGHVLASHSIDDQFIMEVV